MLKDEALVVEGTAADRYWQTWGTITLRFAARDRSRVPSRWTGFDRRHSPVAPRSPNRHAVTPINALLNYGYRLAEIEAVIACHAFGLDPGMGVVHADRQGRPGMALDLMEAGRVIVEAAVIDLARTRTFRKADFAELPTGETRVLSPLSHDLAAALLPALRDHLAPIVGRPKFLG